MSEICRLCLSSDELFKLFEYNGAKDLHAKILFCLNIKINPNVNLPLMICKSCNDGLNKFYDFKKQRLEVDAKLQTELKHSTNINKIEHIVTPKEEYDDHNNLNYTNKTIICNNFFKEDNANKLKFCSNIENKDISDNRFQCEICGQIFKIKTGLENHLLTHSGLKHYVCKLCPKKFCRAENLRVHTQSHAGIKLYICEICGKPSSRRQDLIRHKRIHSDNRDYSCPRCDRHFKRSSDISSHMRTHTGIRPYSCEKCSRTYTSHSGLRKHKKRHCK